MQTKNINIIVILLAFLLLPSATQASILYFDPSDGNYGQGDEFAVDIRLDVSGNCINTVEANIGFTKDTVGIVDFSSGSSILSLWVDKPSTSQMPEINEKGELHFAGGIPGGYCGRIPGDPGASNVVGTLILKIPGFAVIESKENIIKLNFLEGTRALINDGLGTADSLITKDAEFTFAPRPVLPKDEWEELLRSDTVPPEPFIVELHQDLSLFEGKYYIIYSTTDKQSGVDHYEVLEIKSGEQLGVEPKRSVMDILLRREKLPPEWTEAVMPYLLSDQSLSSIIKVRAIDKAGNERMVEYIPLEKELAAKKRSIWWLIVPILIIAAFILIFWILFNKKSRRKNESI